METGYNWVFDVYLIDPGKLIMNESQPSTLSIEWDMCIQIVGKTHKDAIEKIPEEYKNWYVSKVEGPMDKHKMNY